MDSLFLMQRYWGSDEEDNEDLQEIKEHSSRYTENESTPSKKLKTDDSSVIKVFDLDSDIEELVEPDSPDSIKFIAEKIATNKDSEITSTKEKKVKSNVKNDSIVVHTKSNEQDSVRITEKTTKNCSVVKKKKKVKNTLKEGNSEKPDIVKDGLYTTIGQVYQQTNSKKKQQLPNWLNNPTYIGINLKDEDTPVSELQYLDSNTKKILEQSGIKVLFPVQLAVIPWLMQCKTHSLLIRPSDICVSAPTGSGKTLAFVLPIVQSLRDRLVCRIKALVVLPVNELAIQVYKVFETFIQGTDLKIALLTGQKSFLFEQKALVKYIGQKAKSLVDIVVTTPGRVTDHMLRTKGFCLKQLRYLVIDEADRMMEDIQHGWLKQVEYAIFRNGHCSDCVCLGDERSPIEPSSAYNFGLINPPLQKLLFSATLTHDPEQLHSLSLYKPKLFTASSHSNKEEDFVGICSLPETLSTFQVICETGIKPIVLSHLIQKHSFKKVLCFTESIERAHRLHLVLEKMGLFQVREISSSNRPVQRKIVLEQFALGKITVLVCSDLVARGMDIDNIDCVISYDVPHFIKTYIHRIGRTARAGKSGTAITLLSDGEIPRFKKILTSAGIELPKEYNICAEELKHIVTSYQKALTEADAKLRQEKSAIYGNMTQKKKWKKRKKIYTK